MVGPKSELDSFENEMNARYELTVSGRLGPRPNDDKESSVLNRIVRWTPSGLECEADPRRVEKLLEELDLGGDGVKSFVLWQLVPITRRPIASTFSSRPMTYVA